MCKLSRQVNVEHLPCVGYRIGGDQSAGMQASCARSANSNRSVINSRIDLVSWNVRSTYPRRGAQERITTACQSVKMGGSRLGRRKPVGHRIASARSNTAWLSSPHRTHAAQARCEMLDQTATVFPGSRLLIRFSVRPPPRIGLAFPGSPVERSSLTDAETGHFCTTLCQEV